MRAGSARLDVVGDGIVLEVDEGVSPSEFDTLPSNVLANAHTCRMPLRTLGRSGYTDVLNTAV
jgi:hypothetical protein